MKDVPLNDLLPSTDLDKMHKSLTLTFPRPKPKLDLSSYPICRAPPLVEFNDVLLWILTSQLAYTPYPAFERILARDV